MRQLAILLLLACTACATRADGPPSTQAAPPPAAVQAPTSGTAPTATDTLARIQALIGKAECTGDSQCQVLPVGAKACGGPASYLAFSNAKTDTADVQALAARYHAEQQANNQQSGMISNCRVMPVPVAACRANTCQLTDPATAVR